MGLTSEQMTELVDIREQFVSRHMEQRIHDEGVFNTLEATTTDQFEEWRNEGYREFRRLYPHLNSAFAPHLPEHVEGT